MAAAANKETHASAVFVCPRSFKDESYLHGFLGTVGDLQKAGALQDVVLEVEGRRFPCHRLVLSAASPYFRAMFRSDMAEIQQKTVVLQGLNAVAFEEILSYIYSGTLHVTLDKVQPLYQAADLLRLAYVKDTCSSYMVKNMEVERSNCVNLYKFADVCSQDIVRGRCQQWIIKHFTEIASSEEFCSLSVTQLTDIISHDELDVKEETTVWETVVRWVQHSREDRLHHLPSILPHIRFNLLTSDDTAAILEHPLVKEHPGSSDVIRNMVQKGNPNLKPRLGMFMEMAILSNPDSNELLFMNPKQEKYISCSFKPEDMPFISALTVTTDNNIYILTPKRDDDDDDDDNDDDDDDGDDDDERESDDKLSVFKYNHARNVFEPAGMSPVSKGWRLEKDFVKERLVEVDQTLYYLVENLEDGVVQMKKYNQNTDQWQECSELRLKIPSYDSSAAVSYSPYLFFLTSDEVHKYDPSEDSWWQLSSPKLLLHVSSAVHMESEIFWVDEDFSQTIVYDTWLEMWQTLQGRPNPGNRQIDHNGRPSLFFLDNQLHVWLTCVNDDDEDEKEHLVYVHDRAADTWTDLKATLPSKSYRTHGCSDCPVARIYLPYLKGE